MSNAIKTKAAASGSEDSDGSAGSDGDDDSSEEETVAELAVYVKPAETGKKPR